MYSIIQKVINKSGSVLIFLLQGDNVRDRALGGMMDGVLEVKKEDLLKMVGQNIKFCLSTNNVIY